jgi:hypothetical protein
MTRPRRLCPLPGDGRGPRAHGVRGPSCSITTCSPARGPAREHALAPDGLRRAFNRPPRTGHLFQNRYKSIVVEEEPYRLELVRYLHLNPLRAGVVPDLHALARFPRSGHSALLGRIRAPWQATERSLPCSPRRFPRPPGVPGLRGAGVPGRRPELQGGA